MALSAQGDELDKFLERLHDERGWDFRHYKKTSVSRRITMRLNSCNASSFDEYRSVLQSDPSEYDRLFSTLTIKVTEFFREPEVFEMLGKILPEKFKDNMELRAWSCGCAYGHEAVEIVKAKDIDLIISDLKMPGMGGKQFYDAVNSVRPDRANRIIFISGDTASIETQEFIKGTGNYFLKKPFTIDALKETISKIIS